MTRSNKKSSLTVESGINTKCSLKTGFSFFRTRQINVLPNYLQDNVPDTTIFLQNRQIMSIM